MSASAFRALDIFRSRRKTYAATFNAYNFYHGSHLLTDSIGVTFRMQIKYTIKTIFVKYSITSKVVLYIRLTRKSLNVNILQIFVKTENIYILRLFSIFNFNKKLFDKHNLFPGGYDGKAFERRDY